MANKERETDAHESVPKSEPPPPSESPPSPPSPEMSEPTGSTLSISCTNCKENLPSELAYKEDKDPCPKCGSDKFSVTISIRESIDIHSNIKLSGKDKNLPSKKNPRIEIFKGDDLRKSDGRWMKKERLIDKSNNLYKEIVIDPQTEEIVHQNEEPLSDHFDHGSAKKQRNSEINSIDAMNDTKK